MMGIKIKILKGVSIILIILLQSCISTKTIQENNLNHIWTFTYLKALENQKVNLQAYLERNWFAMDSIAVKQKLIRQYELYENKNPENQDWDFILSVEYLTPKGYDAIATEFEAIRTKHQVVKVNGLGMKELVEIVKSETISKKRYIK